MRVYKIISSKGDMRIVEAETQPEAVKLFEENVDIFDNASFIYLLSEHSVLRDEHRES